MFAILSQLDIYSVSGGDGDSSDVSDIDDYSPAHICRTGCPIIRVDNGKLGALAERERSICVAYNREDTVNPLRTVELDLSQNRRNPGQDVPYVAISHVRAEGMGNSRGTELPQCQIRQIQGFVDSLTGTPAGSTFFWVDALCVPTDRRAKKLAARQICRVFASANSVLALVPSIMSVNSSGVPNERLLAAIAGSPWPTRLWTFQEGAVAKQFFFQFRDSALALDDLLPPEKTTLGLAAGGGSSKGSKLLDRIVQFSDDIKIDNFPNPLRYGKGDQLKLSRHRAKTRLRSYLRLSFLMMPMFQYFSTERERMDVPEVKRAFDTVYVGSYTGIEREQRLERLKRMLELLDGRVF